MTIDEGTYLRAWTQLMKLLQWIPLWLLRTWNTKKEERRETIANTLDEIRAANMTAVDK